jgi:hypothetical protein
MRRVHVVCEGPTELTFVREVLQPWFTALHLIPFLPGKHRGNPHGGDVKYARVKPDILRILKHDRECCCTTLFDYYALGEFPSYEEPRGQSPEEKAARIENAVADDVAAELGAGFDRSRFFCHLSMHEFEGLLFSDPRRLALGLYRPDLEPELAGIRAGVPSPEHIDEDRETAPSKRLKRVCGSYNKVTGGNVAALTVGIEAMSRECAHFHGWLAWFDGL